MQLPQTGRFASTPKNDYTFILELVTVMAGFDYWQPAYYNEKDAKALYQKIINTNNLNIG
jgi:hypothetical protein